MLSRAVAQLGNSGLPFPTRARPEKPVLDLVSPGLEGRSSPSGLSKALALPTQS